MAFNIPYNSSMSDDVNEMILEALGVDKEEIKAKAAELIKENATLAANKND